MIFATSFALIALPALVAAQYGPPPSPAGGSSSTAAAAASVPSAPPSTQGQVNINVAANGQFVFSPNNVTASVGTNVTFYYPMAGLAHSVTQSSFDAPCTPAEGGFDSGLQEGVQMTITITNASQPIWFFCKQVLHCGMGMVGSINAPLNGTNTFEAYQAAAEKIGSSETTVPDNGPKTGGIGAVLTATPAATAASASGSSPSSGAGHVVTNGAWGLVAAALAMAMA